MTEAERRLAKLRQRMVEAALDGLVVSAPANIFYLSGFRGSAGCLLVTGERALLSSDFRYRWQGKEQAPGFEFLEAPAALPRLGEAAEQLGLGRLGYDAGHLTCEQRDQLAQSTAGVELVPASGLVEALREVKSAQEVERIRAAAHLADRALALMVSLLRPGAREREIALEGEFLMRRAGAEQAAFDLIVASGPRSALPHAQTTDRPLQAGDLVVIDIGARLDGYCSDITRTFAVASASDQTRGIYSLVYRAQRAGAAAVREGVTCGDVDAAARDLIEEAGYGEAFGHSLGHGVGIEVHEGPRLKKGEVRKLTAGHVVTVEPGIYLEGLGGVRLEDMVLVRPDGSETLTGSPMAGELPVV
jgi:Xaa-Pro aminopeptidase